MQFKKVSLTQFKTDVEKHLSIRDLEQCYTNLALPKRATEGSAGYDFHIPFDLEVKAGHCYTIPTGIRAVLDAGYVLFLAPRSSFGLKHGFFLLNTLGVIDSDYAYADNEGHIHVCFKTDEDISLKANDRFVQGIILPFGVTDDDQSVTKRHGGFGSSGCQ